MARSVTAIVLLMLFVASGVAQDLRSQHRALNATAVTVPGTAVTALSGPANGCNISSPVALIINQVGTAGTTATGTSQLQPAGAAPYQCGALAAGASVSVNCSGGGTCAWSGDRW